MPQINDEWAEIFDDYKKARYALWGARKAKAWCRDEETGRYYMWKAYHRACKADPKDYLVFARVLAMMADESRSSTFDYKRYHKFIKPSMEAYELAIEAGQQPAEKELEKIRHWADSLAYILSCEKAPYDEQIKYIKEYEQLEDFQFHDSKPVWFELTGKTARLKLKFYDTFVTFLFEGILDIHVDADPVTDWIMEFYCYPCFHDEKKLQFDIGFYKIMCSAISVEKIETVERKHPNPSIS